MYFFYQASSVVAYSRPSIRFLFLEFPYNELYWLPYIFLTVALYLSIFVHNTILNK